MVIVLNQRGRRKEERREVGCQVGRIIFSKEQNVLARFDNFKLVSVLLRQDVAENRLRARKCYVPKKTNGSPQQSAKEPKWSDKGG